MRWLRELREQSRYIIIAAVGWLLVAILVVGIVGLLENRNMKSVTDRALRYDVELEDDADDLRAAILDLRHYHRNIYFGGPSRTQIENLEGAYRLVLSEISELERLGVRDPDAPRPESLRRMAREYYADWRPAIDEYERTGNEDAFADASDLGVARLSRMEEAAAELDKLGEQLSARSLQRVEAAATRARVVLLTVVGGLLVAGAGLAYAAVRMVGELRRLYAEQRALARRLAELSRARTEFLADASHELRTPLTVLRGNAEVGLQLATEGEVREILQEIVGEAGRMARMVEDMLFLARSEAASPPVEPRPVEAAPFLSSLADRAGALARERGARLEAGLSAEGRLVLDRGRVEQAVLILVDNAAKYGRPGGRISLLARREAGELVIEVSDDGPGIPEEELPRIFERFYRVDKTRARRLGGAGLGLPIAKTIAEAHGGTLEARSRPGEGTTMTLRLPAAPGELGAAPSLEASNPAHD
ncbi:periplasmic sensor signal transduction histidine kinase [Rubrobacter xylanophilus DSM 9941]|uniref:histidine kinase n=1 Tax=Rubrobacter xylanophilus (strain DSM 9941 / JCM 11954 / NBRC 16129 / PRD-1) TaxID=266117 RepID=Q1AZL4_RUBXD|nr:ATP-binding protein [Rubrobacter xylanophilus]ABG03164.1 periplasmic sensor signal transduction histidine kinase [Rubrobacter xylanophilus DSM 9941]